MVRGECHTRSAGNHKLDGRLYFPKRPLKKLSIDCQKLVSPCGAGVAVGNTKGEGVGTKKPFVRPAGACVTGAGVTTGAGVPVPTVVNIIGLDELVPEERMLFSCEKAPGIQLLLALKTK